MVKVPEGQAQEKTMELVMSNNYVEIEEEMMYLDGGIYINNRNCTKIALYFGSGYGLIQAAGSFVLAKKCISIIGQGSGLLAYAFG